MTIAWGRRTAVAAAFAAGLAASAPAFADRMPTAEELGRIEAALKKEGFTRWDDIELDDGVWEVDDAVGADGVRYDLELDPKTLAIVKRKRD